MSAAYGQVQASRLTGGLFFARLFKDLRKLYKTRKSHFKTHKIKCALCQVQKIVFIRTILFTNVQNNV